MGSSVCLLVNMTGCLKTPESEYVSNKEGQATLIEDHAVADNGIPIAEQLNLPERVTRVSSHTNEYTTIEMDAKVLVPNATSIPVESLTVKPLTEETIEKWTGVLFDSDTHNVALPGSLTVEDCYESIEYTENVKEGIATGRIEVTSAGTEILYDAAGNPVSVPEEYADSLDEVIQEWENRLQTAMQMPDVDSFSYDFIENKDTWYVDETTNIPYTYDSCGLSGIHENKNYDCYFFRMNGNTEMQYGIQFQERLDCGYSLQELELSSIYRNEYQEQNKCRYSYEEAIELCQEFLQKLDIDNMECQYAEDLDLYVRNNPDGERGDYLGRKGYKLYFMRTYGEMGDVFSEINHPVSWCSYFGLGYPMINSMYHFMDTGTMGEEEAAEQMKKMIAPELMEFIVLDDGIIAAHIVNLMEEQEQLAENVLLVDFETVLSQGMTQMETIYGTQGTKEGHVKVKIQMIEMDYVRMQSPDDPKEFAMIPVWDFRTGANGNVKVTINAIDGTVFDREKGY